VTVRAGRRLALFVVAGAVVAGVVGLLAGRGTALGTTAFPAPRQAAPRQLVSRADFVGAARCASCHRAEYDSWARSTHGRAGGAPSRNVVIAAFDGRPIRFSDAVVTPRVQGGRYLFVVEQDGTAPRTLPVDGAVGGGHMAGGGTQGFVSRWPDGTWRFLPFDYSRQAGTWFCNTGDRLGHGWQPITRSMPLAACGDWPPTRVLGDVPRFANCQGCHGSQIAAAFDSAAHGYATAVGSLAVDCESCHGPGRRHVELGAAPAEMARRADIGMAALATLDKDQSLRVCYQCHALKDQLRPGYLPGDSLERHYSLALPLLGDRALHADGRVRTFSYQENQRYSDCYRNGGMRCTDCHDPHSQSYRDVNGAALPGRLDDRQCTSCHASLAVNGTAHTRHRADSPGSRCVSCHMPYLQHPEVGKAIRYARADHTIPVPRPLVDSALGVRSACAGCHAGVPAAVLQQQITAWTGRPAKPLAPSVAAQLAAGDGEPTAAVARAMLADDGHTMAHAAALARLLETLVAGGGAWLDDPVAARLRELSEDRDVDVAALALATLHLQRGTENGTRRFLARALSRAGDDDASLRDRWALVLGYVGDRRAAHGEGAGAIAAYRLALEITPENARLLVNLANAERDAARDPGELARSLADYARALRLDPSSALTLVNQGIAQAAGGDTTAAVASWQRAMRIDPGEPLAPFNLGNVFLLRGQPAAAAAAYRAATTLDASLAPAHFNLARALVMAGQYGPALRALRDGLRFDSTNADAHTMAALLQGRLRP
jgi:tetratricopeptide (TPR) repeat protein